MFTIVLFNIAVNNSMLLLILAAVVGIYSIITASLFVF